MLSQKEPQRASVINSCIKREMACAKTARLLGLSVRQIKRLKKREREGRADLALVHTHATFFAEVGESIKTAQALLGTRIWARRSTPMLM